MEWIIIGFVVLAVYLFVGPFPSEATERAQSEATERAQSYNASVNQERQALLSGTTTLTPLNPDNYGYIPVAKENLIAVQDNASRYELKSSGKYLTSGIYFSIPIVKGVRYRAGGGRIRSEKSWQVTATGRLLITDQAVVFESPQKNERIKWGQIADVELMLDGYKIAMRSGLPRMFAVDTPDPKFAAVLELMLRGPNGSARLRVQPAAHQLETRPSTPGNTPLDESNAFQEDEVARLVSIPLRTTLLSAKTHLEEAASDYAASDHIVVKSLGDRVSGIAENFEREMFQVMISVAGTDGPINSKEAKLMNRIFDRSLTVEDYNNYLKHIRESVNLKETFGTLVDDAIKIGQQWPIVRSMEMIQYIMTADYDIMTADDYVSAGEFDEFTTIVHEKVFGVQQGTTAVAPLEAALRRTDRLRTL